MKKFFTSFVSDESGATAIEYGLIAALLGIAIVTAVTGVGTALNSKFNAVSSALNTAGTH
jgi:pilus assembly protein Flp/PilA